MLPGVLCSALKLWVKELLDAVSASLLPRPVQAIEVKWPKRDTFQDSFQDTLPIWIRTSAVFAFVKVCSGRFERNANYKHMRHGKMMRFSSPTAFMAQKKEIMDEAFAGDIVGLPDTGNFKIGDSLTAGEDLHFKGLPSFSPEMFKYIENDDPMKTKQLNLNDHLMDEGVARLFINHLTP
jgi:peptide chain release factor 3